MAKQKWRLPFRRSRINYEDVGYAPFYLQHDVGFSGTKIYRPVEERTPGYFTLLGHYGMTRKDALAELRSLAGKQSNPGHVVKVLRNPPKFVYTMIDRRGRKRYYKEIGRSYGSGRLVMMSQNEAKLLLSTRLAEEIPMKRRIA